jgi:hypothetical protein
MVPCTLNHIPPALLLQRKLFLAAMVRGLSTVNPLETLVGIGAHQQLLGLVQGIGFSGQERFLVGARETPQPQLLGGSS